MFYYLQLLLTDTNLVELRLLDYNIALIKSSSVTLIFTHSYVSTRTNFVISLSNKNVIKLAFLKYSYDYLSCKLKTPYQEAQNRNRG